MAYRLPASESIATLRTDAHRGPSDEDARARLAQYSAPTSSPRRSLCPVWRRFLSQFSDVLVILLFNSDDNWPASDPQRDAALVQSHRNLRRCSVERHDGVHPGSSRRAAVAALRELSAAGASVIRGGERRVQGEPDTKV